MHPNEVQRVFGYAPYKDEFSQDMSTRIQVWRDVSVRTQIRVFYERRGGEVGGFYVVVTKEFSTFTPGELDR